MDNSSVLIGIFCILLIISPIFLMNILRKRKGQLVLAGIQAHASENHGNITQHEYWNNYILGIDTNAGKIYYSSKIKNNESFCEIDLSQIQTCRITNIRNNDNSDNERLVLEFAFLNNLKAKQTLEFYNSEFDGLTMHEEYQLAEKWLKIINDSKVNISKKK